MRMTIPAVLAMAFAAIPVAHAQNGAGQIACQKDVQQLSRTLDQRADSMAPAQVQNTRQRLYTLNQQCKQGLDYASPGIAQLRRELGTTQPQSAHRPGSDKVPGYE